MTDVEEQPKKCEECKHSKCDIFDEPCRSCLISKGKYSKWEKEENENESSN